MHILTSCIRWQRCQLLLTVGVAEFLGAATGEQVNPSVLLGDSLYLLALSQNWGNYFCYKIVVGSIIEQRHTGVGDPPTWSNAHCRTEWVGQVVVGYFANGGLTQHYGGGDFDPACQTPDKKRRAELRMFLDPNVAELQTTVNEPALCDYTVEIRGPLSAYGIAEISSTSGTTGGTTGAFYPTAAPVTSAALASGELTSAAADTAAAAVVGSTGLRSSSIPEVPHITGSLDLPKGLSTVAVPSGSASTSKPPLAGTAPQSFTVRAAASSNHGTTAALGTSQLEGLQINTSTVYNEQNVGIAGTAADDYHASNPTTTTAALPPRSGGIFTTTGHITTTTSGRNGGVALLGLVLAMAFLAPCFCISLACLWKYKCQLHNWESSSQPTPAVSPDPEPSCPPSLPVQLFTQSLGLMALNQDEGRVEVEWNRTVIAL